jgi:type I site-specific restriction endonuclease
MTHPVHSLFLAGFLAATALTSVSAQTAQPTETKEAAYTRTITERAAKIVATLGELDAKTSGQVRDVIANQYRQLNDIHEKQKTELSALKSKPQDEATKAEATKVDAAATAALDKLHAQYLKKLGRHLTAAQIEKVKDGMTYSVAPNTMRAYNEMLPNLTEAQKAQMLAWLVEAREHAMDASTSEKKHAWFGKYKGKINNYLSAAGIDMNQAGKDWQARRAAEAGK